MSIIVLKRVKRVHGVPKEKGLGNVKAAAWTTDTPTPKRTKHDTITADTFFTSFILARSAEDRETGLKQDAGYSVNQKPGPEYPQVADEHLSENFFGLCLG